MNSERVWFRLTLVAAIVAGTTLLGAAYFVTHAARILASSPAVDGALWEHTVGRALDLALWLFVLRMLAWTVPIACVLLFYLVRWALTGNLRPLWPLQKHAP